MEKKEIKLLIKKWYKFKKEIKDTNNKWFIKYVKYNSGLALCFDGKDDIFIGTWSSSPINLRLERSTNTKKILYEEIDVEINFLKEWL